MPSSRSGVDMRFFDQPGYPDLFEAWSEVLTQETPGVYTLEVADALARTIEARRQVQARFGYDQSEVTMLERIACRNARIWQAEIDEYLSEGAA